MPNGEARVKESLRKPRANENMTPEKRDVLEPK
jgi:hypothetical protein